MSEDTANRVGRWERPSERGDGRDRDGKYPCHKTKRGRESDLGEEGGPVLFILFSLLHLPSHVSPVPSCVTPLQVNTCPSPSDQLVVFRLPVRPCLESLSLLSEG